jgi:NADH-quinone oxidoreductase subunit N
MGTFSLITWAPAGEVAPPLADARDLLTPEIVLTSFGCLALALAVTLPRDRQRPVAYASLVGVALAVASTLAMWWGNARALPRYGFFGTLVVDELAIVLKSAFLFAAALAIATSARHLDEAEQRGEHYALALFATVGMMVAASGADLVTLYASLELAALSACALVAGLARGREGREAALRYFLLGGFASAVALYGTSLVYGLAGSTGLGPIREALAGLAVPGAWGEARDVGYAAAALVSAGVWLKDAAVPLRVLAPDAREDAPAPFSTFASVGLRAAGFAVLARLLLEGLPDLRSPGGLPGWALVVGAFAAVAMTWGNLGAITERGSKRMLAYASASSAGYVMLGLIAGDRVGCAGFVVSLVAYVVASVGAFGVLAATGRGGAGGSVDDFEGLAKRSPGLAALMTVFVLGLAGLPPTAGFVGRVLAVEGLVASGDPWLTALALVAVLNMAVSAYYYFSFVKAMFVGEPAEGASVRETSGGAWAALGVAAALTVLAGLFPQPAIAVSERAVERIAPVETRRVE